MRQLCLFFIFCVFGTFHTKTFAGWKRTNANASIIANTEENLIKEFKKIAENSEGDRVGDYDQTEEVKIYLQDQLADAYATLLFWAYKSPNQKRYVKQVGKTISTDQLRHIKIALERLKKIPNSQEDKIQEYIIEQSEKIAEDEIKKTEKDFLPKNLEAVPDNS